MGTETVRKPYAARRPGMLVFGSGMGYNPGGAASALGGRGVPRGAISFLRARTERKGTAIGEKPLFFIRIFPASGCNWRRSVLYSSVKR